MRRKYGCMVVALGQWAKGKLAVIMRLDT